MSNDEKTTIVTGDDKIKNGKVADADIEMLRQAQSGDGLYVIETPEDFERLCKAAEETYKSFEEQIADMTQKEAAEVRRVRVDEGYSWRAVAQHFNDLGDFGAFIPPSNQLAGLALCEKAAQMFGEHYMKPPWNGE